MWQKISTADPVKQLQHYEREWAKHWGGAPTRPEDASEVEDMFRIPVWVQSRCSVDALRGASNKFKIRTCTKGGWHPKHFALLGDASLNILSWVFWFFTMAGQLPKELQQIEVALYRKPTGGRRPIGFFDSVYRLWSAVTRDRVQTWEDQLMQDHPAFNAVAGCSVLDPVYRQAMRAEAARHSKELVLLVLLDLAKCYEHVRHDLLWRQGIELHYPLAELRVTIQSYRWERRLTLDGILGKAIWPAGGIVAGHSHATTELKLYMLKVVRQHVIAYPKPALNIFVDDLAVDGAAPNEEVLLRQVLPATRQLINSFGEELHLPVAASKVAVVGSTWSVTKAAEESFGLLRGKGAQAVRYLGVDAAAGRSLAHASGTSVRQARRSIFRRRFARLRRLQGKGTKKGLVFAAGLQAGVTYGKEVWGVPRGFRLELRRKAAAAHGLVTKGGSVDLAWQLIHPQQDPEQLALATIIRWAKEVLWATAPPDERPAAATSLYPLLTMFGKVWRKVKAELQASTRKRPAVRGPHLGRYLHAARVGLDHCHTDPLPGRPAEGCQAARTAASHAQGLFAGDRTARHARQGGGQGPLTSPR